MRIVSNTGTDRVVDHILPWLQPGSRIDMASEALSFHAFGELAAELSRMAHARLVLPPGDVELGFFGTEGDRSARNRLQGRWLATRCADWVERTVEVRRADRPVPQGAVVLRNGDGSPRQAVFGSFSFSTDGLGLTPGNPLNLIQASETAEECERLGEWLDAQWSALSADDTAKVAVVDLLRSLAAHRDPLSIYALILHHLFRTQGDELDEEQVVKSATGIRNAAVWQKLFKFQRDGVVGAIDKLNRFGGCVIADSVGLGKPSRRSPSSSTMNLGTTESSFCARSACATTGHSTAPTIAATFLPATASTTTSSTTPTCRVTAGFPATSTWPT